MQVSSSVMGVFSLNTNHSTQDESFVTGVSSVELQRAQELIRQLKEIKEQNELSYPRIMDRIEKNGKSVSLSTLRRVFADNSEANANSFSYENTLLPIAEALFNVEDIPTPEGNPFAKEISGLKAVIHLQNEEITRLHELKEHLETRITFLLEQIEKKDRRMDEKDEMIKTLLNKVLLCGNCPADKEK